MACRGTCARHAAPRPPSGLRYSEGQKRCHSCATFMEWAGLFCPCCGRRLRSRPSNARGRTDTWRRI